MFTLFVLCSVSTCMGISLSEAFWPLNHVRGILGHLKRPAKQNRSYNSISVRTQNGLNCVSGNEATDSSNKMVKNSSSFPLLGQNSL